MRKKIILGVLITIIVIFLGLFFINTFCFELSHRGEFPVNAYCSTCGEQGGIAEHICKNPNGKPIYCSSCGKIKIGK